MNSAKSFFSNLVLFSRASPFGATYEAVALCALARLGVDIESHRLLRLFDTVEPSCAICTGTIPS
jgi:hypothetical protein